MNPLVTEARDLSEKATPGPWGAVYDGSGDWSLGPEADPQVGSVAGMWRIKPDDAALIARYRTLCLELADLVEQQDVEMRLAHARLEECAEHKSSGTLRERIDWKITQLAYKVAEKTAIIEAIEHTQDELRSKALSAECRVIEVNYRASTACRARQETIDQLTADDDRQWREYYKVAATAYGEVPQSEDRRNFMVGLCADLADALLAEQKRRGR